MNNVFGQTRIPTRPLPQVASPQLPSGVVPQRVNQLQKTMTAQGTASTSFYIDIYAEGADKVINHDNFRLYANGNAEFAGDLVAASGTFSGELSAATGTFAGALSAATGTFAGTVSAGAVVAASNFTAPIANFLEINGEDADFSGVVAAASMSCDFLGVDDILAGEIIVSTLKVGTRNAASVAGAFSATHRILIQDAAGNNFYVAGMDASW